MSIVGGSDQRTVVPASGITGNISNVVAVDVIAAGGGFLPGSGYMISAEHLLTAEHVMDGNAIGRVTLASNVAGLPSRANFPSPIPVADRNIAAQVDFDPPSDMALVRTTTALVSDANVLGMLLALDVDDLGGLSIDVTGFPWVITQPTISNNTDNTGRTLYTADGTVSSTTSTTIQYSQDLDTEGGQSGSGIIIDKSDLALSSPLSSIPDDLIVGVHTNGGSSNNAGNIITEDAYRQINDQMENDFGGAAATRAVALPMNVILGTDSSPSFGGNDYFQGNFRREMFIGQGGEDRFEGAGGDDEIIGGDGVDQALFSGLFTEYNFTIIDANSPVFEFDHARGSMSDGKDKTTEVEFAVFEYEDSNGDGTDDDGDIFLVPLLADPDDPTKLRDGPDLLYEKDVLDSTDADAEKIGTLTAELPAFTLDGDLDYTLTVGVEQSVLYNFAYIVDSSGSMAGTNIIQTRSAFQSLTEYLITEGLAERSNFAVVDFDSSAQLFSGLDGPGAIARVNSLPAGGGTNFGPALSTAESWFESLDTVRTATNIAYFLSDGFGSGPSNSLQVVDETFEFGGVPVEVRAFGIGSGADLSGLNTIDSNSAELLLNPSDLIGAFASSGVNRDAIERIDVKLNGAIVDTIDPADLTDDPLGLTYEGSLDGLNVAREADNEVIFELVFNDGTPTASVTAKVTSGQEEIIDQTSDGTQTRVVFSIQLDDYDATALAEESVEIVANDLSNTITLDDKQNTVFANGGNDRVLVNGGQNVLDGGDGIDTAIFNGTLDENGGVSRNGAVVSVGSSTSLVSFEYLQFDDVLIDSLTLVSTPILSVEQSAVAITEGNSGTQTVKFTLSLSTATINDVEIEVQTRGDSASKGTDFNEVSQTVTIAAGSTSAEVEVEILGDSKVEGDEAFFIDVGSGSNALFANGSSAQTFGVVIENDDSEVTASLVGDSGSFLEDAASPTITITRSGDVSSAADVAYEISGVGPSPATADDFDVSLAGIVSFSAGQDKMEFEIGLVADSKVEADEEFVFELTSSSDGAKVAGSAPNITILNDDEASGPNSITGTASSDNLIGTDSVDVIRSLGGRYDKVSGGSDADQFVFGAETSNGIRERDVILDYEVGIDEIVLEDGACVASIRQTSSQVVVFLDGDRDAIYIRGDGVTADNLTIVDGFDFI